MVSQPAPARARVQRCGRAASIGLFQPGLTKTLAATPMSASPRLVIGGGKWFAATTRAAMIALLPVPGPSSTNDYWPRRYSWRLLECQRIAPRLRPRFASALGEVSFAHFVMNPTSPPDMAAATDGFDPLPPGPGANVFAPGWLSPIPWAGVAARLAAVFGDENAQGFTMSMGHPVLLGPDQAPCREKQP